MNHEEECNIDFAVEDLKVGDFLHVEWSKTKCGIPNGYQCYILKINEDDIDVIMEYQPASCSGWCYDTIKKSEFKKTFWSCNIHRRNVNMEKLIQKFNGTIHNFTDYNYDFINSKENK